MSLPDARHRPLWLTLLIHESRLFWRGVEPILRGKKRKAPGRTRLALTTLAALVFVHALGFGVVLALPSQWVDTPALRAGALLALLLLATWLISAAMTRIVAAFYERRDLDLLLSAPVDAGLVLAVRVAAVTVSTWALFALFVYPILNMAMLLGRFWMAPYYVLLPLLAMLATALALLVSGAVIRVLGVRRARAALQIVAALSGALIYLASQAGSFVAQDTRHTVLAWITRQTHEADASWIATSAIALMRGDALAWLVFPLLCAAALALSVRATRARFVASAQTPEATARGATLSDAASTRRIARGFARRASLRLVTKEWTLLLRDPRLLTQVALQLLYLLPLVFFSFGRGTSAVTLGTAALVAASVALAGTLAASLAWLTVSGEDAPDLLAASPLAPLAILSAKLIAAVLPPLALAWLVGIGIGRDDASAGLVITFYATLACVSAALIATANPLPGKRSDFQRRARGNVLIAIVEQFGYLAWAVAAGAAAHGALPWCAALTALALVFPAAMAWRLRARLSAGSGLLPIGAG